MPSFSHLSMCKPALSNEVIGLSTPYWPGLGQKSPSFPPPSFLSWGNRWGSARSIVPQPRFVSPPPSQWKEINCNTQWVSLSRLFQRLNNNQWIDLLFFYGFLQRIFFSPPPHIILHLFDPGWSPKVSSPTPILFSGRPPPILKLKCEVSPLAKKIPPRLIAILNVSQGKTYYSVVRNSLPLK